MLRFFFCILCLKSKSKHPSFCSARSNKDSIIYFREKLATAHFRTMWTFMRDYRWSTILLAGFLLCTDKTTAFQPHHHRLSSTGLSSAPFERLQPITRPNYVPHQQNPSKPNRWRSPTLLSRFSTKSVVGDEEPRTPTKWIHSVPKPLLAAMILIGLDVLFSKLLQAFSIGFPSSLAGCGALFVLFLFAPGGASLYELLSPGAALFAKWLPVFFVPSLVTLPLADSLGSVEEVSQFIYCYEKYFSIVFFRSNNYFYFVPSWLIAIESCRCRDWRLLFYTLNYCIHCS